MSRYQEPEVFHREGEKTKTWLCDGNSKALWMSGPLAHLLCVVLPSPACPCDKTLAYLICLSIDEITAAIT